MDNTKRMVYAEDVLVRLKREKAYMSDVGYIHAKSAVNSAPTVEVAHGRWTWCGTDKWNDAYLCSECGKWEIDDSNYCPNCGAKMDLEEG